MAVGVKPSGISGNGSPPSGASLGGRATERYRLLTRCSRTSCSIGPPKHVGGAVSKPGFIYVAVEEGLPGFCKVGQTKDPVAREKSLGGSGTAKIRIVESVRVEDMDAVEDAFHKILPERNRLGEWFNIETERVLPMLRCLGSAQEREHRTKRSPRAPDHSNQATRALPGKTPQTEFYQLIVDVLEELGGSGRAKDVTARVGDRVQLRSGDLEQYESGQVVWKNSVAWARQKLKDEGTLKASRHGWWELAKAPSAKRIAKKRTARSGKTPTAEFRQPIVDVLEELGGSGRAKDVTALVGERVRLRSGDLEQHKTGGVVWENSVAWARLKLRDEGILKSGSPWGVWELA